jgi:integrase/recombinase XerD
MSVFCGLQGHNEVSKVGENFLLASYCICRTEFGIVFTNKDLSQGGQRKYLLPAERKAVAQVCESLPVAERLFILTLLHTGCRLSEALELTRSSIDERAGYILFRTLKQRDSIRHRAVPIPETLMTELLAWADEEDWVRLWRVGRTQAWTWVKNAFSRAELSGIAATPKGLRHGFGVACMEVGVPLTLIQKWMGHADLRTTAIYLNVSGAEERRQAMRLWELMN